MQDWAKRMAFSAFYLSLVARALLGAIATEELVLKRIVGQLPLQGPAESNRRCALQITLHNTARCPNTTAISREFVPLPARRSICLNCLMISLLFAGTKIFPFIAEHWMSNLLTREVIFSAENRPAFDGMVAGFGSESAKLPSRRSRSASISQARNSARSSWRSNRRDMRQPERVWTRST
ncbi:hypothetical protein NKI79_25270 [Mesorhizobium sp. M0340]|uniref:hypothetical protein n=1 Tax=Mesorhizobium sp. M0340 TaxID=2956939 RepID=UPI003336C6ED